MGCASSTAVADGADADAAREDADASARVVASASDAVSARRGGRAERMRDEASNSMTRRDARCVMRERRARRAAVRVRDRWKVPPGSCAWRFWMEEETTVSALETDARGARLTPENGDLSLMMCSHDGLEVIVGEMDEGRVAVRARVFGVDVFLTADGAAMEDGRACAGEPEFDRDRAIEFGLDEAGLKSEVERRLARELLDGKRACGRAPWCTLLGSQFSDGNHFVHLPLMAASSYSIDGAILDPYSKSYGHSLMCLWSELCHKLGPGEHELTVRLAPLGIVVPDSDSCLLEGEVDDSAEIRAFVRETEGGYETSPDAEGMSATFSLVLREEDCTGRAPERSAQEWAPDWPSDEIEECYVAAMEVANTGPPGEMAAKMAPGSVCCHVILPSTDGQSGIAEVRDASGSPILYEFHAWGLFRGVDGAMGAQIKFRVVQDIDANGQPTGPWRSADYESRPCNGLSIKNSQIDKAIARDDSKVRIPGGVRD